MLMNYEAIVIGTSAGGLQALHTILTPLPADFRLPLLVVQHRLPTADDFLVVSLNKTCHLKIKEADEKDPIEAGCVYIAPANYHLLVEGDKTLSLSVDSKVCYSRPAIDVLFETASDTYGSGLIGVILTGANHDGTAGLKKIKENGGLTIAQEPTTAEADLMPRSAIRENVVDNVFSLAEIGSFLGRLAEKSVCHE